MGKDTIYRQDAINLALEYFVEFLGGAFYENGQKELMARFQRLPSAQPEIIRCKDCKDYQTDWETSYPNRHYCATMDSMMPEDGFCNYAERKTDE